VLGKTRKFAVLGVLLSAVMILGACAPAATPAPTSAPSSTETPTTAPVETPMTEPTTAPAEAPTTEATMTSPIGTPAATPPTTGGQGPTVAAAHNDTLGDILVDSNGMTLYTFKNDQPDMSNCTDTCAQNWPPLTVASMDTMLTAAQGITGTLGVIQRQDNTFQVTYNHMPLYRFAKDTKPGDANGQGVGNLWYVVQVTPAASQ